jgi:hypothetical protein
VIETIYGGVLTRAIYDVLKYILKRIIPLPSKYFEPKKNKDEVITPSLSPYERISKSERFISKVALYFLTYILYQAFTPTIDFKFITFLSWIKNLAIFLLWVLLYSSISLMIIEFTNWFFNSYVFINSKFVFKILRMPFRKVGKLAYVRTFYLANHNFVILILSSIRFVKVTVENKLTLTTEFYQCKNFIEAVRNNEVTKYAAQRVKGLIIYYCTSIGIILFSIMYILIPKTLVYYILFLLTVVIILYLVYVIISFITAIFNSVEQANLFSKEMERIEKGVLIRNRYFIVHQIK